MQIWTVSIEIDDPSALIGQFQSRESVITLYPREAQTAVALQKKVGDDEAYR